MSRVILGRVAGAFGIRGWIKVQSHTRPLEGILDYPRWRLGDREHELVEGRSQGNAIVAKLEGVGNREAALALRGCSIEVERSELPAAAPGEYYWADLVGCMAKSVSGAELGRVEGLFSNGAQDVLVVRGERERLVPFVQGPIVKSVDLKAKTIVLDWNPEY